MNFTASPKPLSSKSRALLIGTITFVSYAYFYQGGGWNQNSRFDLVRAILEQGTLRIDAYHENTGDKAFVATHYYSDKAPGLALLAVPLAAAMRPVLHAVGMDPASPRGLVAMSYVVTVLAVALPTALACACLFLITLRLGSSVGGAAFAALSTGLATPIWAYATLFWGHDLAGACLVFAFAAALKLPKGTSPKADLFWGMVVGLMAGWATVTEYPAAPAAAIIAALALAQVWSDGWQRRLRAAIGIAAGALPCVAVLMGYQYLAFGSLLHPSYSYYPAGAFPWMKRGYMGLTYPRIDVALKLLFGCRRGLLFVAPVALAAPFGLRWLWRQTATRAAAAAASLIAAYYFLFHASFSALPGDWSYGPRYMGPGVPLLCLGLAPLWSNARLLWQKALSALAICSGLFALMAVSVTAQPPSEFKCPLPQLFWPSFWAGKLSLNLGSMLKLSEENVEPTHGAFNLGELAGLHGLVSLIPLLVLWSVAGLLWIRMNKDPHE